MNKKAMLMTKRTLARIEARPGDRLNVRYGEVWVTQEGDLTDYVLAGGQELTLNGEPALVTALESSMVEFQRAEPSGVLASLASAVSNAAGFCAAGLSLRARMQRLQQIL